MQKRHLDGFINRARWRLKHDPIEAKSIADQSYRRLLGLVETRPFEDPRFEAVVRNTASLLAEAAAVKALETAAYDRVERYLELALEQAERRVEAERVELDGSGRFYLTVALKSLADYRVKLAVVRAPGYEVPLDGRETRLETIIDAPGSVTVTEPDAASLVDAELDLDRARDSLEAFRPDDASFARRKTRFAPRLARTRRAIEAYLAR